MSIVSDAQDQSYFDRTRMRAALYAKVDLEKLTGLKATPQQWLNMALDPQAFSGTRLSDASERFYRKTIFEYVAHKWMADPANTQLGMNLARALQKQPGVCDYSTLALLGFAKAVAAEPLPPIANDSEKAVSQAIALAAMHRLAILDPDQDRPEKESGQTLRDKLDAQLAAYVAPPLPLPGISIRPAPALPSRQPNRRF